MKPKLYFMVMLVCSLLGILGISKIDYSPNREREYNGILVKVDATGADAFKVEEIVTFPIERSLSNIGGLQEIRSTSEVGKSNIYLKFKDSIDFRTKSIEIREKLDLVSATFPKEFHKPHILRYDPAQKPIYIASFESKSLSINDLRLYLENKIKPSLSSLDGVNLVEIAGGELEEIQVSCDPFKLESYKISLLDVINRIQDVNKNFHLGYLSPGINELERSISLNGKYENIFNVQLTPLLIKENGKGIVVKDVCDVSKKPKDSSLISRINGEEKASIFIYGTSDSSIVLLSGQIENAIKNYLREDVSYLVHTDLSRDLFTRLKSFGIIFFALGLFFSIRFKFNFKLINLRYLLVIFCLALSFVFFFVIILKIKVTEVSLTAFLLSLVLFYLSIINLNKNKTEFLRAFYSIFTLLLLSIVVVLSYLDTILFKEYLEFYITFILSLSVLWIYSRDIHLKSSADKQKTKSTWRVLLKFEAIFKKIKEKSKTKISESKKKYLNNFYIFPASVLFLSTLGVVFFLITDFSNKLENEGFEISAVLEFPAGTSFDFSNRITRGVEEKLRENEDIKDVISKVESDRSLLIIKFKENTKIDKNLLTSLKKSTGNLEEAYLHFISDLETPLLNEYTYDLSGPDLETLENLVAEISRKLKEKESGEDVILRFKPSREELELIYRGDKFIHSGISILEFGEQIRTAIQGGVASKIFIENKEVDIRVRYDETFRKSVRDLNFYKVKNISKGFVPIEQIIEVRIKKVPSKIYHKDRSRVLSFAVQTDLKQGPAKDLLDSVFSNLNSDINYRIRESRGGENKNLRDIILRISFIFALGGMFFIDFKRVGSLALLKSYREIYHFFPFFFLLIYFHQSSFGLYLQVGFLIGFSLERALGKSILTLPVIKELFFITLIANMLVPPIFFSSALLLNTILIYLYSKRFYLQVSSRWMRLNSLQSWEDIFGRIRTDIRKIQYSKH